MHHLGRAVFHPQFQQLPCNSTSLCQHHNIFFEQVRLAIDDPTLIEVYGFPNRGRDGTPPTHVHLCDLLVVAPQLHATDLERRRLAARDRAIHGTR